MQNYLIQIDKEELVNIINDAVQAAMPKSSNETSPQPFIKGIHELARFLKVSPARAQKMKNEGLFPFWQDGRTLLFDPNKVREAMAGFHKKGRR